MPAVRAAGQDPAETDLPAGQEPGAASRPAEPQPRSRRQSAGSSRASSAGAEPFFADPGTFDPDREADAADEPAGPDLAGDPIVLWTPDRIRRILTLQGTATHALVGVADTDWVWQPAELDMVCGPLADYANRVPQLAAIAHVSDDAAVAMGFGSYLFRSYRERVRELQRRAAEPAAPPTPVTGRAPADDNPSEDRSWTVPPA